MACNVASITKMARVVMVTRADSCTPSVRCVSLFSVMAIVATTYVHSRITKMMEDDIESFEWLGNTCKCHWRPNLLISQGLKDEYRA